jgi:hypothetical protein
MARDREDRGVLTANNRLHTASSTSTPPIERWHRTTARPPSHAAPSRREIAPVEVERDTSACGLELRAGPVPLPHRAWASRPSLSSARPALECTAPRCGALPLLPFCVVPAPARRGSGRGSSSLIMHCVRFLSLTAPLLELRLDKGSPQRPHSVRPPHGLSTLAASVDVPSVGSDWEPYKGGGTKCWWRKLHRYNTRLRASAG